MTKIKYSKDINGKWSITEHKDYVIIPPAQPPIQTEYLTSEQISNKYDCLTLEQPKPTLFQRIKNMFKL